MLFSLQYLKLNHEIYQYNRHIINTNYFDSRQPFCPWTLLYIKSELHYINDTIDGEVRLYNMKGQRNLEIKYTKGEIYYQHYLIYSDYVTTEWIDGKPPSDLDSTYEDMLLWSEQPCPFMDERIALEPTNIVVVFNSWTNKITYIIIAISSILLILNLLNIKKNANKRNR